MTTLCLLRHGRASGHGPEAALLPEGEAAVTALGRKLGREGWVPAAAFTSPYARARDTARIVLAEAASDVPLVALNELTPDWDPGDALFTLERHGLPEGHVLVVAHMPLLARMVLHLSTEPLGFDTAMMAELELRDGIRAGRVVRVLEPGA